MTGGPQAGRSHWQQSFEPRVGVGVAVGVAVGVTVGVLVRVAVWVDVTVCVGVAVRVGVGVWVGVKVRVCVGVGVRVTQLPVPALQTASNTGTQPRKQLPLEAGPQAGRLH